MKNQEFAAFSELIRPCAPDEFLAEFQGRKTLLQHGPVDRFPAWLRHPAFRDPLTLLERHPGDIQVGCWQDRRGFPADASNVPTLLNQGMTAVFRSIEFFIPEVMPWTKKLVDELGLPQRIGVSVQGFASGSDGGLDWHADPEEGFWLQLSGTKEVWYSDTPALENLAEFQYVPPGPLRPSHNAQFRGPFPTGPEASTVRHVVLEPGSMLYLPLGTWHRTRSTAGSFSVHIFINPPRIADTMISVLRNLMYETAHWRAPIYGATPGNCYPGNPWASLDELKRDLVRLVERIEGEHLALAAEASPERVHHLSPRSWLRRDPTYTLDVTEGGGQTRVIVRGYPNWRGDGEPVFREDNLLAEGAFEGSHAKLLAALKRQDTAFQLQSVLSEVDVAMEDAHEVLHELIEAEAFVVLPFTPSPE